MARITITDNYGTIQEIIGIDNSFDGQDRLLASSWDECYDGAAIEADHVHVRQSLLSTIVDALTVVRRRERAAHDAEKRAGA